VNCAQTRNLLHAFLDGELDLVRHLEIEHHLAECPACSEEYDGLRSLGAALKTDGLYFRAPTGLAERVRASLRRDAATDIVPAVRAGHWRRFSVGVGVAAGIVLLVGGLTWLGWNLFRAGVPVDDRLAREVVASHIRSLQAEHLTDVTSSDKHRVKPWFKGKTDFSPAVCDLAGEGYPLVGGRLDYLDNRAVAALVYRRRQHVINIFVWPAESSPDRGPATATRNGYHVVQWVGGGMTWWVVSDLNPAELREFADMAAKEAGTAHP
jgi:anti-sigma factor RsiW